MLDLAQIRELNALVCREARRRHDAGDPRNPVEIAPDILVEIDAPDVERALQRLRTLIEAAGRRHAMA